MVMNFRLWDHATDTELDVTCDITYTYEENQSFGLPSDPFVFPFTTNPAQVGFVGTVNELWSVAGNWVGNALPTVGDIAVINAPCHLDQDAEVLQLVVSDNQSLTVMEGYTLTAGSIVSDVPSKLVVADGGQLVCDDVEGVYATIQKFVEGYGEGDDKWSFIASPLVEGVSHNDVGNLVNEDGYDLYSFDQTFELEWRNYKKSSLTLNPGEGYLYANTTDAVLEFSGELNSTVDEVPLYYDSDYNLAGWNLIGNPYTFNVYADRSYYVLNEEGTAINPVPASGQDVITPCTGIMVKASSVNESVRFSPTAPSGKRGTLKLLVSSAERGASSDCAIISFNSDDVLTKYVFNNNNPKLSISEGGKDYAIAAAEMQGELPISFKASKNGVYTLSANASNIEFEYLHLIDNLTGNDVNLLETPSYSFNARTTDYATRFKVVFICGDANDDNETFAYYNGTEWVFNNEGEAILQVYDSLGRVMCSETIYGKTVKNLNGLGVGVYMIRLVSGNNVKMQKIVVK